MLPFGVKWSEFFPKSGRNGAYKPVAKFVSLTQAINFFFRFIVEEEGCLGFFVGRELIGKLTFRQGVPATLETYTISFPGQQFVAEHLRNVFPRYYSQPENT